ncbi:MAG TPA: iron-sulfur cluster carrier protein ApbC [Ignavibacteriaceae bacterium]|nr:iron-sulfur cluster carrier protein ApbC [Ignavibacteriaceae bacterium]
MSEITKSGIINSIKKINHPSLDISHITLNSIRSFETENGKLKLALSLPVPANSAVQVSSLIKGAILKEFMDLTDVDLKLESKAPGEILTHKDPKKDAVLPGVKNTIAVASGKGGVGKSTVAVNLAVALAKDGAKVGLIDADVYGPSIPLMLGLTEKPKVYQAENSVKMLPLEKYGVKIMSIGLLVDENSPVIWRGPMASGAVKQFMSDVDWGELDYLIFDLPPGTGDIQLTLVQTIPLTGAIVVTTPQEVSLIDARKAFKMFERVNVPILGVVENMSYFIAPDTGKKYDIFGTGGGSKMAETYNAFFLGGIPIDPRVREGGDKGVPIVYDFPDSEQANIMMRISHGLTEQVNKRNSEKSGEIEILLGEDD